MKKKFIYISCSILLFIIAFLLTNKMFENDIFYSIKIGELISDHGIDFKDHFTWIGNLNYTYPHWLMDLLIYRVYDNFGNDGIYIFTIFMFVLLISLIFFLNIRKGKKLITSLITVLIIIVPLSYFSSARAQCISYIVFLLEIYFIEQLLEKRSKLSIISLCILPIILANIHIGTFYLYFVLFIPSIVEYIIAIIIEKLNQKYKVKFDKIIFKKNSNVKLLFAIIPCSFLLGLITPLGTNVYTYYIKVAMGTSTDFISEYNPTTFDLFPSFYYILLFIVLAYVFTNYKLKGRTLFLILGLSFMTILQQRNYAYFLIISSFVICDLVEQLIKDFRINPKITVSFTFIIISIVAYKAYNNYMLIKDDDYINSFMYPVEASEYIKNNLLDNDVKLYNDYDYGSYLILQGIPVFIDSRAELYNREFNDKIDETFFSRAMRVETNYENLFFQYNVTHALVHKYSMLNNLLKVDPRYNLIYEDTAYIIYELKFR